jgi:predicted O-methyltransferase YrrM
MAPTRPLDLSDLLDRAHEATVSLFDAIDRRATIELQLIDRHDSHLIQLIEDGSSIASAERIVAADTVELRGMLLHATADVDRARLLVDHWRFLATHTPYDVSMRDDSVKGHEG